MREKWFREHIWWMSFILSLLVVWVHSENAELFLGEMGRESLVYRLESFFAQTLGRDGSSWIFHDLSLPFLQ